MHGEEQHDGVPLARCLHQPGQGVQYTRSRSLRIGQQPSLHAVVEVAASLSSQCFFEFGGIVCGVSQPDELFARMLIILDADHQGDQVWFLRRAAVPNNDLRLVWIAGRNAVAGDAGQGFFNGRR